MTESYEYTQTFLDVCHSSGSTIVPVTNQRRLSRCPIETGTIKTARFESIAPGVIIGSIAASLQLTKSRIHHLTKVQRHLNHSNHKTIEHITQTFDQIDNTYATTLAGDLAEICVYQGPHFGINASIGVSGAWNDSYLPRLHYLHHSYQYPKWEMTDSEVLSGIDGMFIGKKVQFLLKRMQRLSLSQVFDLYYSNRGLPLILIDEKNQFYQQPLAVSGSPHHSAVAGRKFAFDKFSMNSTITSACHRQQILSLISRHKLKEETHRMAQLLQLSTTTISVSNTQLRTYCDAAVDSFFVHASKFK